MPAWVLVEGPARALVCIVPVARWLHDRLCLQESKQPHLDAHNMGWTQSWVVCGDLQRWLWVGGHLAMKGLAMERGQR